MDGVNTDSPSLACPICAAGVGYTLGPISSGTGKGLWLVHPCPQCKRKLQVPVAYMAVSRDNVVVLIEAVAEREGSGGE